MNSSSAATAEDANRPWTVDTSIATRYVSLNQRNPLLRTPGPDTEPLVVSPDGDHFFFVTHYGELSCDCNRSRIWIFSGRQIRSQLARGERGPLNPLLTFDMTDEEPPVNAMTGDGMEWAGIVDARWVGADRIVFLRSGKARGEVYGIDLQEGSVKLLSDSTRPASLGSVQAYGKGLAYLSVEVLDEDGRTVGPDNPLGLRKADIVYPAERIDEERLYELDYGRPGPRIFHVVVGYGDAPARVAASYKVPTTSFPFLAKPELSPNGHWAITSLPAYGDDSAPPASWSNYSGLDGPLNSAAYRRLWRYALVDARSGKTLPMIDAPRGPVSLSLWGSPSIFWSSDSRRAVMVNVSLLLSERDARPDMGYLIDYEVASGKSTVLEPMSLPCTKGSAEQCRVGSISWLRDGEELLVTHVNEMGETRSATSYTLTPQGWRARAASTEPEPATRETAEAFFKNARESFLHLLPRMTKVLKTGVDVTLRQSADDPPMVVASWHHHEADLLPQDRALTGVRITNERRVRWTEPSGHVEEGSLILPEGATSRVPLVIQIGYNYPELFMPDGFGTAAYARRALVARGIAVLEVDQVGLDDYGLMRRSPEGDDAPEPRAMVERLDAAIDELTKQGLIDPAKVGVIGFSRNGFMANYYISHPNKYRPVAAIIADSVSYSYSEYLALQSGSSTVAETHTALGGDFWSNKNMYLRYSPFFNIDKVDTAALFMYHSYVGKLSAIDEPLKGYKRAGREMDAIVFDHAPHQLIRPRQYQASMQASVDWMRFWLLGEQDADPSKSDQYAYWSKLRAQRDARHAKPASNP